MYSATMPMTSEPINAPLAVPRPPSVTAANISRIRVAPVFQEMPFR